MPPPRSKPIVEPAEPDRFNFRFAADKSFKERFERLAEVLGVENAQKHMAEILEQALDVALEKRDPKQNHGRRKVAEPSPSPDETSASTPATSRRVSAGARGRVFARAGYRCEYRSSDGTRCRSQTGLQIEHVRPFGIYHSHDERYLRAFCPLHNRLAADHAYGAEFIQRKIDDRRRRAELTPPG